MAETSLHSSIKDWYSLPGDRFEVKIGNFIVDLVRNNLLIEIQTKNFSAVRRKLQSLVRDHRVRLVYPIPETKWIVQVEKSNDAISSRRRSPKKGRLVDLFDELVWIPSLIREPYFSMEILLIEEEETRCKDGKGSWKRRGASILNRKLLGVVKRVRLSDTKDFIKFVPRDLDQPFSNKSLSKFAGLPIRQTRKMTYCLRKMGAIRVVGKNRNELLFERDHSWVAR